MKVSLCLISHAPLDTVFFSNYYRFEGLVANVTYQTFGDLQRLVREMQHSPPEIVVVDAAEYHAHVRELLHGNGADVYTIYSFGVLRFTGERIDYHRMSDSELRLVQNTLMDMMEYVHQVCVRYDIPYVLHGGTLLGAVRHRGFIPWDDDADIVMRRHDYRRFFRIVSRIDCPYVALSPGRGPYATKYLNSFFLMSGDIVSADRYPPDDTVYYQHLTLDILPLDKVFRAGGLIQRLQKKATTFLHHCYRRKHDRYDFRCHRSLPVRLCSQLPVRLLVLLNELALSLLDRFPLRYCHAFTCFQNPETLQIKTFDESSVSRRILVPFGPHSFYISEDFHRILERQYGPDYMEIPGQELRLQHGIFRIASVLSNKPGRGSR